MNESTSTYPIRRKIESSSSFCFSALLTIPSVFVLLPLTNPAALEGLLFKTGCFLCTEAVLCVTGNEPNDEIFPNHR